MTEHVADEEHQGTQDGEDHHGDDACRESMQSLSQGFHTVSM